MATKRLSSIRKWLLSSPPAEFIINQLREILIGSLRQGPMPKHVAFVMDGNRRFARSHRIETVEGHNLGFEALARILEVCYNSGVTHVTIYAFSIENFKRSKYEVDALMDMAKIKLTQLSQHGELLDRYGARIRILGQRELIKPDVLEAVDRAVNMTAKNDKCVLNVCFPYTSREEITTAIRSTVAAFSKPLPPPSKNGRDDSRNRASPFQEDRIADTIRKQHESNDRGRSENGDRKTAGGRGGRSSQPYFKALKEQERSPESSAPTSSFSSTSPSVEASDDNEKDEDDLFSTTTLHSESSLFSNLHTDTSSAGKVTPNSPNGHHSQFPSRVSARSAVSGDGPTLYPSPETITPTTLTSHMFTALDPPLDLLVRTSGVERLSDFMLWQCHQDTQIVFLDVLWPEFDLWSFLPVLWEWQWRVRREERLKSELKMSLRG